MKGLSGALLVFLATGCAATIGHEPVPGWPQLEVVERFVPHAEMRERCSRYVGFGSLPIACAEFRLAERRCDVWYSQDFPPGPDIVRHERLHCAGYDHLGSTAMRELLHRDGAQLRAGLTTRIR